MLCLTILLLIPASVLADGGESGYVVTTNGYQIELVFKKPVAIGENEFHVQITDSMGMPVSNAEVEVSCQPAGEPSAHEENDGTESHARESMNEIDMPTVAPAADGMSGMDMAKEVPSTGVMRPKNESDAHGTEPDAHVEEPLTIMLEPVHESGEYAGKINIDKSGGWVFNVHFTVNGEAAKVDFPVEIARALGLNYAVLGGFFGINAIVIVWQPPLNASPLFFASNFNP